MDRFRGLADPVRRQLLELLLSGDQRVVDLSGHFEISRPAISRHLAVLIESGLVEAEGRGRERWYRLQRDGLAAAAAWLRQFTDDTIDPLAAAPVAPSHLDALDLEVRRTVRDLRTSPTRTTAAQPNEESA